MNKEPWTYWLFHGFNWIASYRAIDYCEGTYIRVPRWQTKAGQAYWSRSKDAWSPFLNRCQDLSLGYDVRYREGEGIRVCCELPSVRTPGTLLSWNLVVSPDVVLAEFRGLAFRLVEQGRESNRGSS